MASLRSLLPAPTQTTFDKSDEINSEHRIKNQTVVIKSRRTIPPYEQRKDWIPRTTEDYGDGGAFPEIQTVQFPLEMGKKDSATSNAIAVQLDAAGKIKYDVLARQGHSKNRVVYSKFTDLLPSEVTEDDAELQKPSEDDVEELTEKTRLALEKITHNKIAAAMPVRAAEKALPAQYIRYTPSQQGEAFNSGAKQRVIKMVEIQRDPMEPPKFGINKKIPRGPPSPPAPVMHSPTRKVSVKEQQEWKIPPSISNWKNPKGFTIPLDKRLAADGRGLQQVHINENFAKLSEALYIADRKAREAVETRAQMEKSIAKKNKERKEENLRQLAQNARDERAGIRSQMTDRDGEAKERDQLRHERHKDRQRERNLQRAAPGKRSKLEQQRERDISEQIALGVPNPRNTSQGEMQYDQRLFNQSKGMDSGFGDEDSYNVYDKPWLSRQAVNQSWYRPSKNMDKDSYVDELDKLKETRRFVPDKKFSGVDRSARRKGPVQFEPQEDDDPFGLDKFLTEAKKASKRPTDQSDYERSDKKRRRD